jgi:hypothetical protein
VVGLAKMGSGSRSEAKAKGEVAEAEPFRSSVPETTVVTSTTVPEAKIAIKDPAEKRTVSNEAWKEPYREFTADEKVRLERLSGFGISNLNISEIDRINTPAGEVVVAGVDMAKPRISKAELVASLQLADESARAEWTYAFELNLGGTSMEVSYTVESTNRQRILIFANEGQNLAYPVFSDPGVKKPIAFTTKNGPEREGLPSVSLIGTISDPNRSDGIQVGEVIDHTEICQASVRTRLTEKTIAEARVKQAALVKLPKWSPNPTFEDRLAVLAYLAQESRCNGYGTDAEAASRQEPHDKHVRATSGWTLEGILPGVGVPYGIADRAEYGLMLNTFRPG